MFESIVEALYGELLQKCPPERPYTLSELKSDTLPEPIGRYAADALRDAAEAELETLDPAGLSWVQLDHEARSAFDRFLASASAGAAIPAGQWSSILRASVRRALEHTVTPRTGLVDAVFVDSEAEMDHDELVSRISRFHAGLPLRAVVVRALKKGAAKSFDPGSFRSLVDRVHDAMTLDYTRGDWQRDLEPLQSLLAAAGVKDGCPVELASLLIHEVGDATVADALHTDSEASIPFDTLLDLLSGPQEEPEIEPALTEEPAESAPGDLSPDPVPLWQRFQKNLNEPIASRPARPTPPSEKVDAPKAKSDIVRAPANASPRTQKAPISVEEEKAQRPLWQKYRSTHAPELDDLPVSDLEVQILGRQAARTRESFVSTLFEGDEDSYYGVLNQLSKARSWSEASRVIAEDVFKRFQVNIYCEEAVAFTNAVEARYRVSHTGD